MKMKMNSHLKKTYDRAFFSAQSDGSSRSARVVVPLVLTLVQDVSSVVDVGCGTGGWLSVFKEHGVGRVRGLDGGGAVGRGQLEIEPEEFTGADFELPLEIDEGFDLCVCLEVAEHLTDRAAPQLVKNLCELSDVVLFSAALVGQGGINHINERWPSYWATHFKAAGYRPFDIVRGRLWYDARVEWWHRQNLLLFANESGARRLSGAQKKESVTTLPLDVVHPECFQRYRVELEQLKVHRGEAQAPAARTKKLAAGLARQKKEIAWLQRRNESLEAISNSTTWKLTHPFRHMLSRHEGPRRTLRNLAYWAGGSYRRN